MDSSTLLTIGLIILFVIVMMRGCGGMMGGCGMGGCGMGRPRRSPGPSEHREAKSSGESTTPKH